MNHEPTIRREWAGVMLIRTSIDAPIPTLRLVPDSPHTLLTPSASTGFLPLHLLPSHSPISIIPPNLPFHLHLVIRAFITPLLPFHHRHTRPHPPINRPAARMVQS